MPPPERERALWASLAPPWVSAQKPVLLRGPPPLPQAPGHLPSLPDPVCAPALSHFLIILSSSSPLPAHPVQPQLKVPGMPPRQRTLLSCQGLACTARVALGRLCFSSSDCVPGSPTHPHLTPRVTQQIPTQPATSGPVGAGVQRW